ncbi:MAG: zinc-dependent peptidase [Bacteroidales bacterium]|nr:zinc-dependent peptidase [Bacteroidales bacterium]MCF8403598.1 zinc-dependent peptidase [Bacteroidales bacterium]
MFRRYAQFNEQEFFAVAMENFFEKPENFKQELPILYNLLSGMLNLDPLSKK